MAMSEVIAMIDAEIEKLQQMKALASGVHAVKTPRGRPKGSKNASSAAVPAAAPAVKTKGKRKLSPEGRKAIAEAMKRRWAERRKTATK